MNSFSLFLPIKKSKIIFVKYKNGLMPLFFENLGVLEIYQFFMDAFYERS